MNHKRGNSSLSYFVFVLTAAASSFSQACTGVNSSHPSSNAVHEKNGVLASALEERWEEDSFFKNASRQFFSTPQFLHFEFELAHLLLDMPATVCVCVWLI